MNKGAAARFVQQKLAQAIILGAQIFPLFKQCFAGRWQHATGYDPADLALCMAANYRDGTRGPHRT